jgi:alpha/beta superfamily hydrolase
MLLGALTLGAPAVADPFATCPPAPAIHAAGPEREVAIDTPAGRVSGTLAGPEGAPRALALLLHGYTGARDEIPVAGGDGMFARTARAMAERGVATLRIDFLGSGRSEGAWADTRLSGQARDAAAAGRWLRARMGPDLPLGMLGYSQGGLVALRAAAGGGPADRLVLWAPVMDPMATYGLIFGEGTIRAGAALAQSGAEAVVEGTRLGPSFFAELVAADPVADAARTEAAILVITGRRDPLIRDGAALARRLAEGRAEAGVGRTRLVDLDAGHDLGALRAPALLDRVIACSAGFLLGLAAR